MSLETMSPVQFVRNEEYLRPFMYDGVAVQPLELWTRYAESPHGQFHATQPLRYHQHYSYEPREQFLADLGDDVHPVRHMLYTHTEITIPFLQAQYAADPTFERFDAIQEVQLLTAAALHDLGECTAIDIKENVGYALGDVAYGEMADDHKTREKTIRNYLFDTYFEDMPPNLLKRVDEIDLRETSDICVEAFEVIERLGYFILSRRAADIVIKSKPRTAVSTGPKFRQSNRIAQLARLATIVGHGHYAFLRSKQDKFAYIKPALDRLVNQTVVV
jgi:hypothetical protein